MYWRALPAIVTGITLPAALVPALAGAIGPATLAGALGVVMALTTLSIAVAEQLALRSDRSTNGERTRA